MGDDAGRVWIARAHGLAVKGYIRWLRLKDCLARIRRGNPLSGGAAKTPRRRSLPAAFVAGLIDRLHIDDYALDQSLIRHGLACVVMGLISKFGIEPFMVMPGRLMGWIFTFLAMIFIVLAIGLGIVGGR